jgi:hypothetical protein
MISSADNSRLCAVYFRDVLSFATRREIESKIRLVSYNLDPTVKQCSDSKLPRLYLGWLELRTVHEFVANSISRVRTAISLPDCCQDLRVSAHYA